MPRKLAFLIPLLSFLLSGFMVGGLVVITSVILPQWTTYSNPANIVYVSDSTGNDGNTCKAAPPLNSSFATPCKTLSHALGLVTSGAGDWVVLKAGDTWVNQSFGTVTQSGASCSQPLLFTSYGNGARPIIEVTSAQAPGIGTNGGSNDFIAVQGLDFYAYQRDPNNVNFNTTDMHANYQGINYRNQTNCFDLENTVIRWFGTNIEAQSNGVTATISCASPIIVTLGSSAAISNGTPISFIADNSLCSGLVASATYCAINVSGLTFNITNPLGSGSTSSCPNGSTTLNGTGTASGVSVSNLTSSRAHTYIGNQILNAYADTAINNQGRGHSQGLHIDFVPALNLSFNLFDNNGWNSQLYGPWAATMTCASPAVVSAPGISVVNGSGISLHGTPCTGFSAAHEYCVINLSGSTFNLTDNDGSGGCPNGTTTINGTGSSSGLSVTFDEVQAVIFNRNAYISNSVVANATYNFFSNSSAEGAEFRGGGVVQNNIFFQDAIGFNIGGNDVGTPVVTGWTGGGNVLQGMVDIVQGTGNQVRGGGIDIINSNGLAVTNELIALPNSSTTNQTGVNLDNPLAGVSNTTVTGNTICAYHTITFNDPSNPGTGNTISPNISSTANCTSLGFLDGTRTPVTYDSAVLGGPGTLAHLLGLMKQNSKSSWNTAAAVPSMRLWVRQGFNLN